MENLGVLFGVPEEIERWESTYRASDNTVYKRVECKVWVDEGGEYLVPLKFEVWFHRRGLVFRGSITGMDMDVELEDKDGLFT